MSTAAFSLVFLLTPRLICRSLRFPSGIVGPAPLIPPAPHICFHAPPAAPPPSPPPLCRPGPPPPGPPCAPPALLSFPGVPPVGPVAVVTCRSLSYVQPAMHLSSHHVITNYQLPNGPVKAGRRWGQRHPQGANLGSIGILKSLSKTHTMAATSPP